MERALLAEVIALLSLTGVLFASDELYRFSGRQVVQDETAQTSPQILSQENTDGSNPNQQAGQVARPRAGVGDAQPGVGPAGPGGTSQTTTSNEGSERYAGRPPSWKNLNETDSGRNKNAPGEGNTSVASGSNIFGTSEVPYSMGGKNNK